MTDPHQHLFLKSKTHKENWESGPDLGKLVDLNLHFTVREGENQRWRLRRLRDGPIVPWQNAGVGVKASGLTHSQTLRSISVSIPALPVYVRLSVCVC